MNDESCKFSTTGRLCFWAKSLTGLGVSFRCLPAGLSGVVTTADTWSVSFSRTIVENGEEPKNTRLTIWYMIIVYDEDEEVDCQRV